MPRRPNPNAFKKNEQVRISFMLDFRRHPELRYLAKRHGHGDRPRELMRLVQLGFETDQQIKQMVEQARASMATIPLMSLVNSAPNATAKEGDTLTPADTALASSAATNSND